MKIKNIYKSTIVLLIICIAPCTLYGEGADLPLFNPNLMSFFHSEIQLVLPKTRNEPDYLSMFGSGGWFKDRNNKVVKEVVGSLIIPVNTNIAIPLFISSLANSENLITDEGLSYWELFTGSGLIIYSKYFTLGTFFGYYNANLAGFFNENYSSMPNTFNYAVVPIIYTDIWYLKRIETMFRTGKFDFRGISNDKDNDDTLDISIFAKLVITGFDLFNLNESAIEPYYSKSNYDFTTTNDIYAIRLILNSFTIETGYRHFVENYEDSLFLSGVYQFEINSSWFFTPNFLTFSIDNYYKKLGIGSSVPDWGTILLELVLDKQNSFSVSLSFRYVTIYIN